MQLHATNSLLFSINSNISAVRGGTVTVPINVTNNPGFTGVGLIATFNPNVIHITNVTALVSDMPLNPQFSLTTTQGTQWIPLVNPVLSDWIGQGAVVNLTFDVSTNAPLGVSPISLAFINLPDGTPVNAANEILRNATVVSGSVYIIDNITNNTVYNTNANVDNNINHNVNNTPPAEENHTVNDYTPSDINEYTPSIIINNDLNNPGNPSVNQQHQFEELVIAPDWDGVFIGTAYDLDDVGVKTGATHFGTVPQTNAPDTLINMIAALFSITVTILMWTAVYQIGSAMVHDKKRVRKKFHKKRYRYA